MFLHIPGVGVVGSSQEKRQLTSVLAASREAVRPSGLFLFLRIEPVRIEEVKAITGTHLSLDQLDNALTTLHGVCVNDTPCPTPEMILCSAGD